MVWSNPHLFYSKDYMQLIKRASFFALSSLFCILTINSQIVENRSKEIIDTLTNYKFTIEDDSIHKNIENINVAVVNRP